MRTGSMCFSILQGPRCRIQSLLKGNSLLQPVTLASFCSENFIIGGTFWSSYSSKLLGFNTYERSGERLNRKKWNLRPITTKIEGINKNTQSSKPTNLRHEILDETVTESTKIDINKLELNEFQSIQYCDVQQRIAEISLLRRIGGNQQKIAERRAFEHLVTIIVFDFETTGISRKNDRIIEIGLQDLLGGENSTFQTLVNPERYVPNSHIHGITTHMVNRPDVPRMEDLIPILLHYVESRQKAGVPVLFVAHNARCFDVPFLVEEFSRCSMEVPSDWMFVDTLPLARELMKSNGSKPSPRISLQALREYYGIPLVGSAHRAMSDVKSLSMILQRMTYDLKLPVSGLLERSFKVIILVDTAEEELRPEATGLRPFWKDLSSLWI